MLGLWTLLVSPKRVRKMAVITKASTLTRLHQALVLRKYRLLYGSRRSYRPGPKGPTSELIAAVIEMKRRNPRLGCRKIAEQISSAFGLERKLEGYQEYYNRYCCHTGLAGLTPAQRSGAPSLPTTRLDSYRWRQHCDGLFQTPAAA